MSVHQKNGVIISVLEKEESDPLSIFQVHYPASDFGQWVKELNESVPYLLYCKTGKRSKTLSSKLQSQFPNGYFASLKGGYEFNLKPKLDSVDH